MVHVCDERCRLPRRLCVYDVVRAHPGGTSSHHIAALIGVTRQGVDQIIARALAKLKKRLEASGFDLESLLPSSPSGFVSPAPFDSP